jgi:hypothetical protein
MRLEFPPSAPRCQLSAFQASAFAFCYDASGQINTRNGQMLSNLN